MKINDAGLEIIKRFEGLRLEAYRDSVGVWTIGYGHTQTARKGLKISKDTAEELLHRDLQEAEKAVEQLVRKTLTPNQFSALVSFVFNLGRGNFAKSTLLSLINQGRFLEASNEFLKWNKAGGKPLAGLTYRREAEHDLFRSAE